MSDSMLSQEEVDNLFKQATGKSIVHSPSSAPSEKPVAKTSVGSEPPAGSQPAVIVPAPRPIAVPPAQVVRPVVQSATVPMPPIIASSPTSAQRETQTRPVVPTQVTANITGQQRVDPSIERLQNMVSDLTVRLLKAERKIVQLEQNKPVQQGGAQSKDLSRLEEQLENMSMKLEATPGYNAANLFTCSSCGTSGKIASPIKCTHCGQEGWWGWWPRDAV